MFGHDRLEIDVIYFGAGSVIDMRTDHVTLARCRSGGDSPGSAQQFDDGFLALVRHSTLQTNYLAEQEYALSVVLFNTHAYLVGRDTDVVGNLVSYFFDSFTFDARPACGLQVHPTIDADGVQARQARVPDNGDIEQVGTLYNVALGNSEAALAPAWIGHQVAIDIRP